MQLCLQGQRTIPPPVEVLVGRLGRGGGLLHVSDGLLQAGPVLLHPGTVPVLALVRLLKYYNI